MKENVKPMLTGGMHCVVTGLIVLQKIKFLFMRLYSILYTVYYELQSLSRLLAYYYV